MFQLSDLQRILAARVAGLGPQATLMAQHENNTRVMALTMIGEGRGEPITGRVGIGWTAQNRATQKRLQVADVCLAHLQYSTWWAAGGSADNAYVLGLAQKLFSDKVSLGSDAALYQECAYLAGGVIPGLLRDPTHGSTHYVTTELLDREPPAWAKGHLPAVVIGHHSFFAGIAW